MAKLKGPLFSLGASQQIGKALVYFPWKGLNVVREYVIPSNPNTTLQQTQRGYLRDAVTAIHAAQGHATKPLLSGDIRAYALWASVVQAATTWFNQVVRNWLDQKRAAKLPVIYRNGYVYPATDSLRVTMQVAEESSVITNGNLWYGTSNTALINPLACTRAELIAEKIITGLTTGVKYYVQYRPTLPTGFIGSNSGIYHGTPT